MAEMSGSVVDELRRVPVLDHVIATLDANELRRLEDATEWFGLPGGTTLFRQGDVGTDVYVLVSGRLGISVDRGMGGRLVHRTLPGELIGEMALISHEPRTATVTAMRDSVVLRIPGEVARELLALSPPFMSFLLGQLVERLKTTTLATRVAEAVETLVVLPIDGTVLDDGVLRSIEDAFDVLPQITQLVEGEEGDLPEGRPGSLRILIARGRDLAWSRRSLRQADRVLFVAARGSVPDAAARALAKHFATENRPADLMLVHPDTAALPIGAADWLDLFAPDQIFHIRASSRADHRRVARMVTGQAIGVALAGGGARGIAHIGALRAIEEAGIPIDMICGTSMGALVAGSYAHDLDLAEAQRRIRISFADTNAIGDYTLPIVSLSRGRRMKALFLQHFGDARIEDCWRPFFCVASNLTTGDIAVLNKGPLWRALRASSALPGILPPLIDRGEVLVDGALMNNFPVDIMQALSRGRVIGIDISADSSFRSEVEDLESRSLAWMLGRGRRQVPNILQLLMRSGLVASGLKSEANRRAADLLIQPPLGDIHLLSFDRWQAAIEAGYVGTRQALQALPTPFF